MVNKEQDFNVTVVVRENQEKDSYQVGSFVLFHDFSRGKKGKWKKKKEVYILF